jgi:hypothetical protein
MTFRPTDKQLKELGHHVAEEAYAIFCKCGAESDFCMQNPDGGIFGAVNRLRITEHGWHASEFHCTDRFLNKWREISADFQPKKDR